MTDCFYADIRTLKGIGQAKADAFAALGIKTVDDLLRHYPYRYEDRTSLTEIGELRSGEYAQFCGEIFSQPRTQAIPGGRTITRAYASDESGAIELVYFNMPYLSKSLLVGQKYIFYGKITNGIRNLQCVSPETQRVYPGVTPEFGYKPIYRLSGTLSNKMVISAVKEALRLVSKETVPDSLPSEILERHHLMPLYEAIINVHIPKNADILEQARTRLTFSAFLEYSLGMFLYRSGRTVNVSPMPCPPADCFFDKLGFQPTSAQKRVVSEIYSEMEKGIRSNRMIQGDVGSGKTAVAAACAWAVIQNGFQAAIMAPTEVLASQHMMKLAPVFEQNGYKTALLTGHTPTAERREILNGLRNGQISLCIGTHALFTEDVQYSNLRLCVCDEQQRFGVDQRAAFISKGVSPHVIVMSATPIPRTLALILFGDLDISIIDELPPGRTPVKTYAVDDSYRKRIEAFIRKTAQTGKQIYVVCPAIEDNDQIPELRSVGEYAAELQKALPDLKIDLLHGKMKPSEKDLVMDRFITRQTDVLVSTTVIEVGVDNPNAVLMVIENAERFGLSQLHQLRGRVGRGADISYCVLISEKKDIPRLKILTETTDGFVIAQKDLELRGPGEFFGSSQSGTIGIKLDGLSGDTRILTQAREEAKKIYLSDSDLMQPEHSLLKKSAMKLFTGNGADRFN